MLAKTFFIILLANQSQSDTCVTPNNETAQCISLYKCTVLIKALETQNDEAIEFVEKSHCGVWTNEPLVCCGTKSGFVEFQISDQQNCGYQHSDDYYRTDLLRPTLEEYPWLALFRYDQNFSSMRCAGALLNHHYVITAAQCLEQNPTAVRLGEYDVEKLKDCVQDNDFFVCSDNVIDVDILEQTIHPSYHKELKLNDIGLVRLSRQLLYSDYIRPICLPLINKYTINVGDKLFSTGFGLNEKKDRFVGVKKKVTLKLASKETCLNTLNCNKTQKNCNQFICAEESKNNLVHLCDGDYGGPLMTFDKRQWYLEGLYSWSSNACDGQGPVYFTRVVKYLDWITDNVRL